MENVCRGLGFREQDARMLLSFIKDNPKWWTAGHPQQLMAFPRALVALAGTMFSKFKDLARKTSPW